MKYKSHDEVRGEFITSQQDEVDLAAFKEEALGEVRNRRLAGVRQRLSNPPAVVPGLP